MPRPPTGTPRSKPHGSRRGLDDDAPRLRVRFPPALYARLEAFAAQSRSHQGDPSLAGWVRDMVTFCLDHPDLFRRSSQALQPGEDRDRQLDKGLPPAAEAVVIAWQPETITAPAPQGARPLYRQPDNAPARLAQRG